jgi:hypothetical protein
VFILIWQVSLKNFVCQPNLWLTFKEVLLIASSTIRLFSDICKGVGRNSRNDGKKTGGLNAQLLINAVQSVGRFIKITEAQVNDKNFLKELDLISHSKVVSGRAYIYYDQLALRTTQLVIFITRIKKKVLYTIIDVLREYPKQKGKAMVVPAEIIEIKYTPEDENGKKKTKE